MGATVFSSLPGIVQWLLDQKRHLACVSEEFHSMSLCVFSSLMLTKSPGGKPFFSGFQKQCGGKNSECRVGFYPGPGKHCLCSGKPALSFPVPSPGLTRLVPTSHLRPRVVNQRAWVIPALPAATLYYPATLPGILVFIQGHRPKPTLPESLV